jgi:hypothetical protein
VCENHEFRSPYSGGWRAVIPIAPISSLEEGGTMNLTDIRRFEMLVRVKDFGDEYAEAFKATALGPKMFTEVADSVNRLRDQGATQSSQMLSAKDSTASKAAVRAALHETLNTISRTARAISVDSGEVENKFRSPRSMGDQRLAAEARGVWKDAQQYKDQFVALSMPETFLDDLDAQIVEFEKATKNQVTGKEAHIAARAELEIALDMGLIAVLRLDARNVVQVA